MSYKNDYPGYYPVNSAEQPGIQLKQYLETIYSRESLGFLEAVDYDLKGQKELSSLFFDSCLLYIIRRLMANAEMIFIQNNENLLTTRNKLRAYLKNSSRYDDAQIKIIVGYLAQMLEATRDKFSDGVRNTALKEQKRNKWKCFLCGREMNSPWYPTADHLWPKSMGGLSILQNLRWACNDCNNESKGNVIEHSDYHYEEISLPAIDYTSFQKSKRKSYDTAIFAKAGYTCAYCDKPAYLVGELSVGRIDKEDGWHYMNLTAYCKGHNPDIL